MLFQGIEKHDWLNVVKKSCKKAKCNRDFVETFRQKESYRVHEINFIEKVNNLKGNFGVLFIAS